MRKGVVGISARSLGKINVQLIMEALGGGGHLTSAATQIKTDDILGVKQQLIDILNYQKDEGDDEVVKVILLEDVKGRGKKDQVVDLPNGYANFLINSKKAVLANDENIKNLKERQAKEKEDLANELALLKKLSDEINGKSIDLTLLVGKDGRRFGSITTKHVVEKFQEEHDILIDRKKIDKFPDINSAGIYPIVVDLGRGVNAKFEVNVLEESRS